MPRMLRNLGKENSRLLLLVYGNADVMVLENQNSNKLDSGAMSYEFHEHTFEFDTVEYCQQ